ncbi:MAG: hypothetical protein E7289_05925 [Lachnospiraceae bacterium]|nr:hypothetical protein [Lachnospiraceae bacterium]
MTADIEKGHYYVTTYDKDGYVHVTSGASHLDNRDRYYSKAILNKTMFFDIVGELDPNFEFDILKITFPKKIKYTNGKLSKDKMTVTFDYTDFKKGDKIYAYTTAAKSAALSANVGSIKLEGLNKYGHIKKAKTLKVKTKEKIKYIKVNGKKQNSEKIKIKKEGKYKIQVKTNKNIANFEVCYDKTKPKVKILELKNGCKKIVFSDENSGIKYALYGVLHNIESGYIIDPSTYEPDSWTYIEVSDNAGNITKKKVFIN